MRFYQFTSLLFLYFLFEEVRGEYTSFQSITCGPGIKKNITYDLNFLYRISTQNFGDSPYPQFYNETCIINFYASQQTGFLFLFTEFMMDNSDYMKISYKGCNDTSSCRPIRQGDEMIHNEADFYQYGSGAFTWAVSTEVYITVGSNNQNSTNPSHTGFELYIESYDLSKGIGKECNQNIQLDLKNRPAAFIMSPNYYSSSPAIGNCQYLINFNGDIRVNLYDFMFPDGTNPKNTFFINGQSITGAELTEINTIPFYYQNSVNITFDINYFSNKTNQECLFEESGCQRFFIIVQAYQESQGSSSCDGTGTHDMSSMSLATFGTYNYGKTLYENNLTCNFVANNPPKGHRITAEISYESESCCDILSFTGLTKNTSDNFDDWRYKGEAVHYLLFAETEQLTLNFASDGVGRAVGFKGTFGTQDCNCLNRTITLSSQNSIHYLYTPPLDHPASTYCPDMACSWSISFPQDKILKITPTMLDLRHEGYDCEYSSTEDVCANMIHVFDQYRGYINGIDKSLDAVFLPYLGVVNINFTSEAQIYVDISKSYNVQKKGFNLTISLEDINSGTYLISNETLTSKQPHTYIALESEGGKPTYFLKTIKADAGKTIQLFFFEVPKNAFVDIFDGDSIESAYMDTTKALNSTFEGLLNPISSTGSSLTVRVYSPDGDVSFYALASIYGDKNYTKKCSSNFVYNLKNGPYSIQAQSPDNNDECQIILRGFYNDTSDARNAITLSGMDQIEELNVNVYRGLFLDSNYLITNTTPYPNFIFGDLVSIGYTKNSRGIVSFEAGTTEIGPDPRIVSDCLTGLIMSPDFMDSSNSTEFKVQQGFTLAYPDGVTTVPFVVHFSAPLQGGSINVTTYQFDHVLEQLIVNNDGTIPKALSLCASSIYVDYQPNMNGRSSGFLAEYTIGTPDGQKCDPNQHTKGSKIFEVSMAMTILSVAILWV